MNILKLRRIQAHLDFVEWHNGITQLLYETMIWTWYNELSELTLQQLEDNNLNFHEISETMTRIDNIIPKRHGGQ